MADPLSLLGLAAGLVSLGLQTCSGITTYLGAIKCRAEDITSIRRQNDALNSVLQAIEPSLSRLPSDHQASVAAVQSCFQSCETELKALKTLIDGLAQNNASNATVKDRIKGQAKKLSYPFNRQKLQQLESRLNQANAGLQLALQSLGLDLSCLSAQKTTAIVESTNAALSAGLLTIQSEVATLHTPLMEIRGGLPELQRGVESVSNLLSLEIGTMSTVVMESNRALKDDTRATRRCVDLSLRSQQEQLHRIESQLNSLCGELDLSQISRKNRDRASETESVLLGRLLGKPGNLKQICDQVSAHSGFATANTGNTNSPIFMMPPDSAALQTSRVASSLTADAPTCSCPRPRRFSSVKSIRLGSLCLYDESSAEEHFPGCPASRASTKRHRRAVGVRYFGLANVLQQAIQISLAATSGAGGGSFGPTFTYYPTVDASTAPAFRVLRLIDRAYHHADGLDWDAFVASALTKLLKLFREHRASPRAVDSHNWTLSHHLTYTMSTNSTQSLGPLLVLFEALVRQGLPACSLALNGETPLARLTNIKAPYNLAVASIIDKSTVETDMSGARIWPPFPLTPEFLYVLRCCCSVAEGLPPQSFGCGPLSLAVLANNLDAVKHLLAKAPSAIYERNAMGQTPFHLAAENPRYLELLVRHSESSTLINLPDYRGRTPLAYAVECSSYRCRNRARRRKCSRCNCADCALILLKADCSVPYFTFLDNITLYRSSERCRRRYIAHLANRRERLKQLALQLLTDSEAQRLGLRDARMLDFHAEETVKLIQQQGVRIPDALAITVGDGEEYCPIYYRASELHLADLLFRSGFRDVDIGHDLKTTPLARGSDNPRYCQWLVEHGADPFRQLPGTPASLQPSLTSGVCSAYPILMSLAWRIHDCPGNPPKPHMMRSIQALSANILPVDIADNCQCRCSPGGCSPFTYMLQGLWYRGKPHPKSIASWFYWYLESFEAALRPTHHVAAIRFLTFTALDIVHTCCYPRLAQVFSHLPDDVDDVEEDEALMLELLEELVEVFERRMAVILADDTGGASRFSEFWQGYWVDRMDAELARLNGSDLSEEERRKAEELGVVWHDRLDLDDQSDLDSVDSLDHGPSGSWFHELDMIIPG